MKKLKSTDEILDKSFWTDKWDGTGDEIANLLNQDRNQAYTSLVEGIGGMKLDKVKAVTNHSTPEEIHQGGLIDGKNQALTDILENVVKPLYGKK